MEAAVVADADDGEAEDEQGHHDKYGCDDDEENWEHQNRDPAIGLGLRVAPDGRQVISRTTRTRGYGIVRSCPSRARAYFRDLTGKTDRNGDASSFEN